ncbi:MAG: Uncharacterised protein [Flavobacteriia bacterium]|nr:MAG: Uncharacterised protein [Flavobacteriia bacterium]
MLDAADHSLIFHAPRNGHGSRKNSRRCFAKTSCVDDGVLRIGIEIEHRCKIPVHACSFTLSPPLSSQFIEQAAVVDRTKGHRPRKPHDAVQPHVQAPFCIDADQQGNPGRVLKLVDQMDLTTGSALKKNESAWTDLFVLPVETKTVFAPFIGICGQHHQLGHFLFEA